MEREILVANTKTQQRTKINSTATTLGELKKEFRNAGIDFSGMTFTEGISKSQLIDDNSQLPHDVIYKGQTTNNLVIILTNTKKNIASGINRKEVYNIIKEKNLQESVKNIFGRNYTQVSTNDLLLFINETKKVTAPVSKGNVPTTKDNYIFDEDEAIAEIKEMEKNRDAIYEDVIIKEKIIKELEQNMNNLSASVINNIMVCIDAGIIANIIKVEDLYNLKEAIEETINVLNEGKQNDEDYTLSNSVSTSDGSINDADINDMIKDIM